MKFLRLFFLPKTQGYRVITSYKEFLSLTSVIIKQILGGFQIPCEPI